MNQRSYYDYCTYNVTEERHVTTCLHQLLKNVTSGTNTLSKPAVNSLRMKSVTCNANSQVSMLQSLFIKLCILLPAVSTLNHVRMQSLLCLIGFVHGDIFIFVKKINKNQLIN